MGEFLVREGTGEEMPGLPPALFHGVIHLQHQMLLSSWPQRVTTDSLGDTKSCHRGVTRPEEQQCLENHLWVHPGPAMGHGLGSWDEVGFWS